MAWDDEIPTIVRTLMQDQGVEVEYAEEDILKMILVAAYTTQMSSRSTFGNVYKIRVDDDILTPDPTSTATRDDSFIIIVAYKTVINFIKAEIRTGLSQVTRIKDGDSELGFSRDPETIKLILKTFEDDLESLLFKHGRGEGFGDILVSSHRFHIGRCYGEY